MKVLQVYSDFLTGKGMGGTARHIYDLCQCLLERGHKPIVVTWGSTKPSLEVVDRILIHRLQLPRFSRAHQYMKILTLSLQMIHLLRKYKIDLIHAHDYLPGLVSALASIFVPKPVVATFHLPIHITASNLISSSSSSFLQVLKKLFISRVAVIICVSNYTYRKTLRLVFPSHKLKVIYNWLTPSLKQEVNNIDDVLKKFGLAEKCYILSVGGLVDIHKGFSLLIHALEKLIQKGNKIDLAIVGHGPDREKLTKYSLELGVKNHVHFLGYVSDSDLACLYKGCYVFVLPSLIEACSLTLVEAMMFGKPIVATKVGGTPEVLEDSRNGILVDPNPDSLASGIETLLLGPDLKDALAKRSQETVKRFSIKNCYYTISLLETVSQGQGVKS